MQAVVGELTAATTLGDHKSSTVVVRVVHTRLRLERGNRATSVPYLQIPFSQGLHIEVGLAVPGTRLVELITRRLAQRKSEQGTQKRNGQHPCHHECEAAD